MCRRGAVTCRTAFPGRHGEVAVPESPTSALRSRIRDECTRHHAGFQRRVVIRVTDANWRPLNQSDKQDLDDTGCFATGDGISTARDSVGRLDSRRNYLLLARSHR